MLEHAALRLWSHWDSICRATKITLVCAVTIVMFCYSNKAYCISSFKRCHMTPWCICPSDIVMFVKVEFLTPWGFQRTLQNSQTCK